MEEFMSFISVDWTLLFTWANLLILYLIMKRFLFQPIKKMMDDREREVRQSFERADEAKAEAERLRKDYADRLDNARKEAGELLKEANRKAQLRTEETLRQAKLQAQTLLEQAEEQIILDKNRALEGAKKEIAALALLTAAKALQAELSPDERHRLMARCIKQAGEEF